MEIAVDQKGSVAERKMGRGAVDQGEGQRIESRCRSQRQRETDRGTETERAYETDRQRQRETERDRETETKRDRESK